MDRAEKIVPVSKDTLGEFLAYCQQHGREHDESYMPEADFEPGQDHPAYLLQDDGQTVGAACLMRTPNFVRARKGRWMIFHALQPQPDGYRQLLDAMLLHSQGLDYLYGFIPEGLQATREAWEQIGLTVQRYSYVLCWKEAAPPAVELPPGFSFQSVAPERLDLVEAARDVLNASFAGQPGHIGNTVETIRTELENPFHIPGGLLLLCDGDRPVGTVHVSQDEYYPSTAFIAMLGVTPAYQGRGLGRLMICKGLDFAVAHGFGKVELSVSAENEAAVRLYFSEGFQKETVMVCYQYLLS